MNADLSTRFLARERAVLDRYLPSLRESLAGVSLRSLESADNPGIALFKAARGPALVAPAAYGGLGASAEEAAQILVAIGSQAPSLGIVCTMHTFSMATLVEWATAEGADQLALLTSMAENAMYIASGFAEGRPGAGPLDMSMRARRAPDGGWLVTGRKKPCTLSRSMDFLSCGVVVEEADGTLRRGLGLVPADAPGIVRRPFWRTEVLGGAESDELILEDVPVPAEFVMACAFDDALDPVETVGYVWLQLALAATYLGIVAGMVERVVRGRRGTARDRGELIAETEAQSACIQMIAVQLDRREVGSALLARTLAVRFNVQKAIESLAMRCAELLGGLAFISDPDVAYLMSASRAMAFHPAGRLESYHALAEFYAGGPLSMNVSAAGR